MINIKQSCYFKYDFNTILNFYPELYNSNFKYSSLYCSNFNTNNCGLCNNHINDYICPCPKHNYIYNYTNYYNYNLKDLLFNIDIFDNIYTFLSSKNKKLINCTSKNLYRTIPKNNINLLYNTNSYIDIIYQIKLYLNYVNNINIHIDLIHKKNAIYDIFQFLSINTKFIFNNIEFAFITLNKLIEFKNVDIIQEHFDQEHLIQINTEFKNRITNYISTLFNIHPNYINNLSAINYKTFKKSLISLNNYDWPAKTKKNKNCKKCLQMHHMNFCHIHKKTRN